MTWRALAHHYSGEKTITIIGVGWWPRTAKQEGHVISKICFYDVRYVISAHKLEVSPYGGRTVLRLERDEWSMIKLLKQAPDE